MEKNNVNTKKGNGKGKPLLSALNTREKKLVGGAFVALMVMFGGLAYQTNHTNDKPIEANVSEVPSLVLEEVASTDK